MSGRLLAAAAVAAAVVPCLGVRADDDDDRRRRPPVRLRGFVPPGQDPGPGLYRSQVASWASRLTVELQAVQATVAGAGGRRRDKLADRAEDAVREAVEFQRVAARTDNPDRLVNRHKDVDEALRELVEEVQKAGAVDPRVAAAVGRAVYTDERLHAALSAEPGLGADAGVRSAARLAAALERQAVDLRGSFRGDAGQPLDAFARRCHRLAERLQAGQVDVTVARREVAELTPLWRQATAGLAPAVQQDPDARVQAARLDALYRDLAARVGYDQQVGGQLLPQPQPGLPPPPPFADRPQAAAPAGGFGQPPAGGFGLMRNADHALVVTPGEGGGPRVRVIHDFRTQQISDFFAYDAEFKGGVRVATADLNGDGFAEVVTVPGKGVPVLVRVWDGRDLSLTTEFQAFDDAVRIGAFVAAADLTPDGRAWVAVGADAGGTPHVKVFDLAAGKEVDSFLAFDEGFRGGVRVALGDLNGDGTPDLAAAAGPGAPPHVRCFDGRNRQPLADFHAFDRRAQAGVYIACGGGGQGRPAVLAAGTGEGLPPVARVFDLATGRPAGEFAPFPQDFLGGVRVAVADPDRDGNPDLVCGPGPGAVSQVRMINLRTGQALGEFGAYEGRFEGGVYVAGR